MRKERIRTMKMARKYVAWCVETLLRSEIDNGSHWMTAGDGNLNGEHSEKLVRVAVQELIIELRRRLRDGHF